MNGWFITILMMYALELGVSSAKNGEDRKSKYSVRSTLFSIVIMGTLTYMAIKTGF